MRHLFIINPKAFQIGDKPDDVIGYIRSFFLNYPRIEEYTIHVTRWKRDAVGYVRRFVTNSRELVRVYALGGNGTFFEVINGVAGLPNVQVAYFPHGKQNSLLYSFGDHGQHLFSSLRNLVSSRVVSLDTIKAGDNSFAVNCLIGIEAEAYTAESLITGKSRLPMNMYFAGAEIWRVIRGKTVQHYRITMDGQNLDGKYISIVVTNAPVYRMGMWPTMDAYLDDGYMNVYLTKEIPVPLLWRVIRDYEHGQYFRWPEYFCHVRGETLSISSDTYMKIAMDGELFYGTSLNFRISPGSLDFVCPDGIETRYRPQGSKYRFLAAGDEP